MYISQQISTGQIYLRFPAMITEPLTGSILPGFVVKGRGKPFHFEFVRRDINMFKTDIM